MIDSYAILPMISWFIHGFKNIENSTQGVLDLLGQKLGFFGKKKLQQPYLVVMFFEKTISHKQRSFLQVPAWHFSLKSAARNDVLSETTSSFQFLFENIIARNDRIFEALVEFSTKSSRDRPRGKQLRCKKLKNLGSSSHHLWLAAKSCIWKGSLGP